MIVSAGGFRLLVGAIPLVLLLALAGLIVLIALIIPGEDRRRFVLKLAPHVEAAIAAITGARTPSP
ncbi:hypothetical protein OHB24_17180 [Kribbella sp. NBC_00482]|uniref:hypothetical protein n=1 Tax=Kribbella sp. NBC_00482 TaxID=2975968 RepID=UPI002E191A9F